MTSIEIFNLRQALNLSMTDFGRLFGVTATAVFKWESGQSIPAPMIETSLYQLQDKILKAKAEGREKEQKEALTKVLVVGGIAAFLIWLFNKD